MDYKLIIIIVLLLVAVVGYIRLYRHYRCNIKKVTFLFDAIDNGDFSFNFPTEKGFKEDKILHKSLNRIKLFLQHTREEQMDREKYYEQILNAVDTGILVVDSHDNILQHNQSALRLLDTDVLTHMNQVKGKLKDEHLAKHETQAMLKDKHVRIIALSDVSYELSNQEVDSWIKLIRVLTHEIMNTITPVTSLSETLLTRTIEESSVESADVSPTEEIVHNSENVQLEQVEQEELQELAEQLQEDKAENTIVEHIEPVVEEVISPESAVNIEPVLDTPVIEAVAEETEKTEGVSTALSEEEPTESIIEQDNVVEDLPVVDAEIEPEIVEDVKDEFRSDINTETQEKPSEGGFFSRLVKGLLKTKQNIGAGFRAFFLGKKIDDDLFEELEEQLLIADIGVPTTNKIIKNLTEHASRKQLQDAELLYQQLKVEMVEILKPVAKPLVIDTTKKPYVILMVGVNGVGKTTTIGKLARKFQNEGKSVMLAAGDTFRAAAVEQLQVWGERNNIPVVAQSTGSDSASVIFDAMQSAAARNIDILIADTAGRLQNKNNLMDELKKIVRVMRKYDETAPHEIMLTLDAGTGQNAISQAKLFNEAVGLTGITLTKLDGTAKGGVIFAIADQFNLPIRYIGVGEKIEDLREFNAEEFIEALFVHENEE